MPERLFVYGTLRHGYDHPMARLLAREGNHLGTAVARGRLVLAANTERAFYPGFLEGGSEVVGDVFEVSTELLLRMDEYEGCSSKDPEPHPYRRIRQPVAIAGRPEEVWIYLYVGDHTGMPEIPGGDFLKSRQ